MERLVSSHHQVACSLQSEGFRQQAFLNKLAALADQGDPSRLELFLFRSAVFRLMYDRIGPLRRAAQPLRAGFLY